MDKAQPIALAQQRVVSLNCKNCVIENYDTILFFQNDDSTDSGSETDDEAGGPDEELIGKFVRCFRTNSY